MLIAHHWLTDILNYGSTDPQFHPDAAALDDGFVRVGFETEGYAPIPETTGPLVIGRVVSIEELEGFKKPIRHCFVDVGDANGTGDKQSIVCGARNFAEGDLVVVSLPGTVLPGGFAISARETYGRMSAGMICSAAELGLTDKQTKGIITLPEGSGTPGEDARGIMGLDDIVFDVNVTPDRGYALSARGLAREIASAFDLEFVDPAVEPARVGLNCDVPAATEPGPAVTIDPATKADRFGLRVVTGCQAGVESPIWLQRQLMLCGQRPVNAATDVTNYVMMALGQPMHAFDGDTITGGLHVRNAAEGEELACLDGSTVTLHGEDVVICDDNGVQSLAGVMGGAATEISESTTTVYLEAAHWDPITVARTCRRHKMSSEASRRFERGVDPALIEVALDVAATLLASITGGTVTPQLTLVGDITPMSPITMKASRPGSIAGKAISAETVVARLEEVGCSVTTDGDAVVVTPPTWRPDMTMPADLVEEVLRLEGLEDIPSVRPTAPAGSGLTPAQKRRRAVGHALAYNGYLEIIPTPFVRNDIADVFGLAEDDPRRHMVTVQNPLESDYGHIGTTLLPSMLDVVRRNVTRGNADLSLYGVAQVAFAPDATAGATPMLDVSSRPSQEQVDGLIHTLPTQPLHVATVGCGQLGIDGPVTDGFAYTWVDAIESARIVARAQGLQFDVVAAEMAPWHPGRCAALVIDGTTVGYAGELHPQVIEALNLPARTCAMEIDLTACPLVEHKPAPLLSSFPALLQDVALVVDEDTPSETVRRVIADHGTQVLESVSLFDVYRSESLGENKKSLTFSLVFRAPDRTLTDDECSAVRDAVVEACAAACGARLRD